MELIISLLFLFLLYTLSWNCLSKIPLQVKASRNSFRINKKIKFLGSQLCSLPDQWDHTENTKLGCIMQVLHCFLYCAHSVRIVDLLYGLNKEANTSGEALTWPWICIWSSGSDRGHRRFSSSAHSSKKNHIVIGSSWALTPNLCTEVNKIKMFSANRGTQKWYEGHAAPGQNPAQVPMSVQLGKLS